MRYFKLCQQLFLSWGQSFQGYWITQELYEMKYMLFWVIFFFLALFILWLPMSWFGEIMEIVCKVMMVCPERQTNKKNGYVPTGFVKCHLNRGVLQLCFLGRQPFRSHLQDLYHIAAARNIPNWLKQTAKCCCCPADCKKHTKKKQKKT